MIIKSEKLCAIFFLNALLVDNAECASKYIFGFGHFHKLLSWQSSFFYKLPGKVVKKSIKYI